MYVPVNAANLANMNWSIVVIGALIVLPGVYWVTYAQHVCIKDSDSAPIVVEGIARPATPPLGHSTNSLG